MNDLDYAQESVDRREHDDPIRDVEAVERYNDEQEREQNEEARYE